MADVPPALHRPLHRISTQSHATLWQRIFGRLACGLLLAGSVLAIPLVPILAHSESDLQFTPGALKQERNSAPTLSIRAGSPPYLQPPVVSAVISDPTDPAATQGIFLTVGDAETAAQALTVSATSSQPDVVPDQNLRWSGSGANRVLKIIPIGVGYTEITIAVEDSDGNQTTTTINYAASAAFADGADYVCHTGGADLSTAVAVDRSFMFAADNEDQLLRLYSRTRSGLPLATFDFSNELDLPDTTKKGPREVDLEASTRSGNLIYWIGSHSNASGGQARPNRARLFATAIEGRGAKATLRYVGRYDNLRTDLIEWDNRNGHGLGAEYLGFDAGTAKKKSPEEIDGFNIEGLTLAPDSTSTAYLGFRAPLLPASDRTKALLVPITNFDQLVSDNPTQGTAEFGPPILMDLGGLGIRSIECSSGGCVIVAGSFDDASQFALYTWSGDPADAPVLSTPLDTNAIRGAYESIVEVPAKPDATSQVQLLADSGTIDWYDEGADAKDLTEANLKKGCSTVVPLSR
jgi:hypothetical protein